MVKKDAKKVVKKVTKKVVKKAAKKVVKKVTKKVVKKEVKNQGSVKWFNRLKNFGFISGDDGKDYFVHIDGIKGNKDKIEKTIINEGDRVTFEIVEGPKGLKAEEVEIIKKAD